VGQIKQHRPVLVILAAFSRFDEALQWARQTAVSLWGPLELESPLFPFHQTRFYESEMGADLKKQLLAFQRLAPPSDLVQWKHQTNRWEQQCRTLRDWGVPRPLNLDPGYLTEAKLVLASTKDRDHRLYLSDGVFAEGTLYWHGGQWKNRSWTYPDYQSEEYHEFFSLCRDYLRQQYRQLRT
jgi:hypothetical protein